MDTYRVPLAGLAVYSGIVALFTVGDRLTHHEFATSEFCSDPRLVRQAGVYGSIHCAEHWAAWEDFAAWWGAFWGMLIPVPAIGPETSFLILHTWANLVGWANTIVTIALVAGMALLALKTYAYCVYGGGKTC